MFNFFIVFSGFMINASFALLEQGQHLALVVFSLVGAYITSCFTFLEYRNEELVLVAEDILRSLEQKAIFKDSPQDITFARRDRWGRRTLFTKRRPLAIFLREDVDEEDGLKSQHSHGLWLPRIQKTIAVIHLCVAAYAVYCWVNG